MNIGLLECDHVLERFRPIAGDYQDMFAALFKQSSLQFKPFDVCNGEFPPSPDDCDAYLCTGSRYSVYDDVDWIHTLKNFVRQWREAGKPFVGICFGHQMLAEAFGGKVGRSDQGWGVGIHSIAITQNEAWMQPQESTCNLQFMHQDQVQQLPEDSVLLGHSAHCPTAMFRVGERMLGIQGHPEFPKAYSEALLLDRIDRIGAEVVLKALGSLDRATDEELTAEWIAKFLSA